MKRSGRYYAVFLFLLIFLSLLLGLSVSAQEETDNYRQERLQELFEIYNRYRTKEDASDTQKTPTSDLLWDEYLTPLSKLTGEDATNRTLIDLIYHKGSALAPLSWIYYSHPDSHSNPAVAEVYRQQSVLIRSKTEESDDRISFFEGIGENPPTVYTCYTLLLNEIYSQQIQDLVAESDSPQVKKIASDAIRRLKEPQTISPDPNNPTPTFSALSDEDALSYQRYVSYVQTQIAQQRERDVIQNQLETVYRTLYPDATFAELSELGTRHSAIQSFLDKLPDAVSAIQMNTLLETAVHALLDELAESLPTYTKHFFNVTLKQQVSDTVSLASGAIPSPQTVRLAELCFGETYQLHLAIAKSKDLLIEESLLYSDFSEEQRTLLASIVSDYTDVRFDACQTQAELTDQSRRAKLRMEWLALYGNFLSQIHSALNQYSPSVPSADVDPLLQKALDQYTQTDLAIGNGERESGSDPLKEDRDAMERWIRDAEILSYLDAHPVVTASLSAMTSQDRERLCAAINDAASLSDAAQQEQELYSLLLELGAKYQWLLQHEIEALLEEREESGEHYEILNRRLAHSREELCQALRAISCLDAEGRLALPALMTQADRLTQKAQQIRRLAAYYSEQILSLSPTYYVDLMHQLFAGATDDIRRDTSDAEASLAETTMAQLNRLMMLNLLRREIPTAYQQIPTVQALLLQAEERLLPDATEPPTDLTAYHTELTARIQSCVRSEAKHRLQEAYETLMEREADYSERNLNRLNHAYTLAVSEIDGHLFSDTNAPDLLERIESHVATMRQIPLDRLHASPSSEYKGSAEAENAFAPDSTLVISSSTRDPKSIAQQIHQAAKANRIHPIGGVTISDSLRKSLKKCVVTAALDIQLFHPLSEDNRYDLSVLFPEGTDLTHALGIIYIREDGSMEYYEITVRDFLVQFSTSHLSDFYIVSERVVNLIPWIIFLSILLLGEIIVLCLLYLRRRRMGISQPILASILPVGMLRMLYRPVGGLTAVIVLGVAVTGLGFWIAALLLAERRATRKKEVVSAESNALVAASVAYLEAAPNRSELPIVAPSTELMEPLSEVTPEDAELLMSDEEAIDFRQTEYIDDQQYSGSKRAQINLDTIAKHFQEGEIVHLNALKEKRLLPKNVGFVKILARGTLDKPLTILAQDFSTAALKMILLTGGTPIVTHASPEREKLSQGHSR